MELSFRSRTFREHDSHFRPVKCRRYGFGLSASGLCAKLASDPTGASHAADRPETRLHRSAGDRSRPGLVGRCRSAPRAWPTKSPKSAARVGFMYIKNHGLRDADIAAIFQTAARLPHFRSRRRWKSRWRERRRAGSGLSAWHDQGRTTRLLSENLQEAFQFRRPLAAGRSRSPRRQAAARPHPVAEGDARSQAAHDGVLRQGRRARLRDARAVRTRRSICADGTLKQYFAKT